MSDQWWSATQVADHLGYRGSHRAAAARHTMSRLGVPATYVRGARRPEARYRADDVRKAVAARPGPGARTDRITDTEATPMKLTKLQLDLLRAVRDKRVWRADDSASLYRSYLLRPDGSRAWTRTNRLSDQGLIRIGDPSELRRPWLLTDAGRQLLARLDGGDQPG